MTDDVNELWAELAGIGSSEQARKTPVVIRSAATVRWRYVVEAFNAAVRAKLENVAFAPSG